MSVRVVLLTLLLVVVLACGEPATPTPFPWDLPEWAIIAPVKPSEWTTVDEAKDALRRCYYELRALDRYIEPSKYYTPKASSPGDVEESLAWSVFDNGWENSWTKPEGLPPGTHDIWAFGHANECWAGVPGGNQYSAEPLWDPEWR